MTHTYIKVADKAEFELQCVALGLEVRFEVAERWEGVMVVSFHHRHQWRGISGGRAVTIFGQDEVLLEKSRYQDQYVTCFLRSGKEFEANLVPADDGEWLPEQLIHDNNTPGVFYPFNKGWMDYMVHDGRAPSVVTKQKAVQIWRRLQMQGLEEGQITVRDIPAWFFSTKEVQHEG